MFFGSPLIPDKGGNLPANLFCVQFIDGPGQECAKLCWRQCFFLTVIAGLPHPGFEMADTHCRVATRVPDQVIPVPSLYSCLPFSAENCMKLAGTE